MPKPVSSLRAVPTEVPSPRIAFAGTPEFAVPSLLALVDGGASVTLVLTQPDRPAGRGRRIAAPPVKRAALELGLRVEQPVSLGDPSLAQDWGPPPALLVVVAYGLLLPPWVLAWPAGGCINLHASLLPRWRGAAPIQRALLSGDATTGVSIMQLEPGLDTGPVYAQRETPIGARETAGELHDRLAALGAALLAETLPGIRDGSRSAVPQDASRASYAPKIGKAEGRLDWRESAAALERRVRAFDPWPVAFACRADGSRLRVFRAEALPAEDRQEPGRIVGLGRAGIDVATSDGRLRLLEVQPPSGRRMPAAAYLAAHSLDDAAFV